MFAPSLGATSSFTFQIGRFRPDRTADNPLLDELNLFISKFTGRRHLCGIFSVVQDLQQSTFGRSGNIDERDLTSFAFEDILSSIQSYSIFLLRGSVAFDARVEQ